MFSNSEPWQHEFLHFAALSSEEPKKFIILNNCAEFIFDHIYYYKILLKVLPFLEYLFVLK
jgi:hypothetical protein